MKTSIKIAGLGLPIIDWIWIAYRFNRWFLSIFPIENPSWLVQREIYEFYKQPLKKIMNDFIYRKALSVRMWLSDSCATSRHFWLGNLLVQLCPRMKTFLLVPRQAWNHQHTSSWGISID